MNHAIRTVAIDDYERHNIEIYYLKVLTPKQASHHISNIQLITLFQKHFFALRLSGNSIFIKNVFPPTGRRTLTTFRVPYHF